MELCAIDWLPAPEVIMARSKAAAAVDALLSPDPDLRQYRCIGNWADGMTVAGRHDGAGSYYYVLQSGESMAVKVCALRSSMAPDSLARFQRQPDVPMPPVAIRALNEPDFRYQELSFLAWIEPGQPWQSLMFRVDGKTSPEMGRPLLETICVGPKAFYVYAQAYHEVTLDPPALMALFNLTPLDGPLAKKLAPEVNLSSSLKDLALIGYPMA